MNQRENDNNREAAEDALFAQYVDRMLAGEVLDIRQIRQAHPEFRDELIDQLKTFIGLAADDPQDLPGRSLGDYKLVRLLGKGGMGIVYEAWQTSLERPVALKVLPTGVAAESKLVVRFMREAKMSAKLNHANIVAVYGMGVEQHTPYYAMEYIEGETLAQALDRIREGRNRSNANGSIDPELHDFSKIAREFIGVANGLQHAHAKGVTHRDVKPSNLMYDRVKASDRLPDGELRILDFGLARFDGHESLTQSGDLLGTVQYMSPEQANLARSQSVDHRTDIYSLGTTLYEAITLVTPFRGRDVHDTLSQIARSEPISPQRHDRRVPQDLATIALKCMRKEPEDRYQTAQAVAQDLQRFVVGDPIEARPQSTLDRFRRVAWRHRWSAAVATTILTIAGLAILFASKSQRAEQELRRLAYEPKVRRAITHLRRADPALYERIPHKLSVYPWGYVRISPGDSEGTSCFIKKFSLAPIRSAVADLQEAIDLDSNRADAYWHRARAHVLLGEPKNLKIAEQDLNQVLRLDANHVAASVLLSSLLRDRQETKAADQLISQATTAASGIWKDWLTAQNHFESWSWKNASEEFDKMLKESDRQPSPYIGWKLELRQGLQLCLYMSEDYIGSLQQLAILRKEWPHALDLQIAEGSAFYAEDEHTRALDIFNDLYSGESNEAIRDYIAETVCLQHGALVQGNSIGLNTDDELVEEWPKRIGDEKLRRSVQYRMLWLQLDRTGGFEVLRKAVDEFPDDPWFPLALSNGQWLQRGGDAKQMSEKAAERDPSLTYARVCLAFRLAFEASDTQQEDQELEENQRKAADALEEARNCQLRFVWEYIYLAYAYGLNGDLKEANRLFKEVSELNRLPWIEHNWGEMLRRVSDRHPEQRTELLERSLELQKEAVEKNPQPVFLIELFHINSALGDSAAAIDAYEQVGHLDRFFDTTHRKAGDIFMDEGLPIEALAAYGQAISRSIRSSRIEDSAQKEKRRNRQISIFRTARQILQVDAPTELLQNQATKFAADLESHLKQITDPRIANEARLTLASAYRCSKDEDNATRVETLPE